MSLEAKRQRAATVAAKSVLVGGSSWHSLRWRQRMQVCCVVATAPLQVAPWRLAAAAAAAAAAASAAAAVAALTALHLVAAAVACLVDHLHRRQVACLEGVEDNPLVQDHDAPRPVACPLAVPWSRAQGQRTLEGVRPSCQGVPSYPGAHLAGSQVGVANHLQGVRLDPLDHLVAPPRCP